ncbi:MAG: hypothetical protein V1851_03305 [Patescibacteria group bacterium]
MYNLRMENFEEKEQTKIEKVKRGLFFNLKKNKKKEIPELREKKYEVNETWTEKDLKEDMSKKENKKERTKIGFFGKLLIFSIFFFITSFAIAFFMFYSGVSIISTENVDISISGPSTTGGGEELSFQITVQNNNSVDLELADLIIEYPQGTLSASDRNSELLQERKSLNTVPAGSSLTNIFKAVLFGSEGDKKEILIRVEYRAKDSNAIFFKERKYELVIDSSPVVFLIDSPQEIMTGQEFNFIIDIKSNSNKTIKDFLMVVDYPFGFIFKDSNIKAIDKNNVWNFGDIKPNSVTTLRITGILEGQDQEERTFRFYGGSESVENKNEILAKLVSIAESILIKKTLIGAELVLDSDYSPEHISNSEKNIRADILWSNNVASKLTDVEIRVDLKGTVLDKSSVSVKEGFYRSSDNVILWDKEDIPELALLNPGDDGSISFSFAPYNLSFISNSGIKNPEINLTLTISGNQLSSDGTMERIKTIITKKVKINSNLILTGRSLFSVGSFENIGSIPPQVDKATTYTIVLTATNTSNDLSNVKVKASLPAYIKWLDRVSPQVSGLEYNQVGGVLSWNIGSMKAGDGFSTSAKEVSFQISLTPSLSQLGSEPVLVNNLVLEGVDTFTGQKITYPLRDITTRISTDPIYSVGVEDVVN